MTSAELKNLIVKYAAEQREEEVIWFYNWVSSIKPKTIVEIGIKEGGNLKILSTHLDKDGMTVGIDPRKEIPWKMDDSECGVHHIAGDSHAKETKEKLISLLNGRCIDVLFIDGDHSYEGMVADFYDYSPLVRAGGIIAVHDIFYLDPVAKAWEDIPGNDWYESPRNRSSIGIGFIIKGG
jgi:cephalosporin hydroxylase